MEVRCRLIPFFVMGMFWGDGCFEATKLYHPVFIRYKYVQIPERCEVFRDARRFCIFRFCTTLATSQRPCDLRALR